MFHINTSFAHIPPYAVMLLLSFLAGLGVQFWLDLRSGIPKRIAGYLALLSPPLILACAYGLTPLISDGAHGFSSVGALAGMYLSAGIMALTVGSRRQAAALLRCCTMVLPLMYSISKLGCFFAGCCRGFAYDGTFSVIYSGSLTGHVQAFPVQLLESLVFLAIFAAGLLLWRKRNAVWVVFFVSALAKGLLDFLRLSHAGVLISANQILCIVLLIAGTIIKLGRRL